MNSVARWIVSMKFNKKKKTNRRSRHRQPYFFIFKNKKYYFYIKNILKNIALQSYIFSFKIFDDAHWILNHEIQVNGQNFCQILKIIKLMAPVSVFKFSKKKI